MTNPAFPTFLAVTLRNSQIDLHRIQHEITEAAVIGNLEKAQINMQGARKLGSRIALDDFEAGLFSYGCMKAFEPDCIKIDDALIANVVDPENFQAQIAWSKIRLALFLSVEVVAEHVSSSEILDTLCDFGIDKVQGFELGRPRPLSQLFDSRDRVHDVSERGGNEG